MIHGQAQSAAHLDFLEPWVQVLPGYLGPSSLPIRQMEQKMVYYVRLVGTDFGNQRSNLKVLGVCSLRKVVEFTLDHQIKAKNC